MNAFDDDILLNGELIYKGGAKPFKGKQVVVPKKYSTDAQFKWGVLEYGEKAREIIDLSTGYMKQLGERRGGSYSCRLANLSYFIRHYIAVHGLWDARDILVGKREFDLPEIIGDSNTALFVKKMRSIVFKNQICDF